MSHESPACTVRIISQEPGQFSRNPIKNTCVSGRDPITTNLLSVMILITSKKETMKASKTMLSGLVRATASTNAKLPSLSLVETRTLSSIVAHSSPLVQLFATNPSLPVTTATINKQWYHATPVSSLAERKRRRKRGGVAEENDESAQKYEDHKPVTDPSEFEKASAEILEKLHTAIKPMQAINDPFDVVRTHDSLIIQVEPSLGRYDIEIDFEEQILILRSPISGAHTYFFSQKTREWVDTTDFHAFEGLFVRDLIRHCKGVPKL